MFHAGGGFLTIDGRSQHLSLLVQAKLQTMSNIWSWNCGEEKGKKKKAKHGSGVVVHVSLMYRSSRLPEENSTVHRPRGRKETSHVDA